MPTDCLESFTPEKQLLLFAKGRTRWDRLCQLEPRLLQLEKDVRARSLARHPFSQAWAMVTRRMRRLVGWFAEHPECRCQDDYDAVYKQLLGVWSTACPLPQLPE